MGDYQELDVWQRALKLAVDVYQITNQLPPTERYGLVAQMRKAAVSIPANIAEGCGRSGDREFKRFLHIARGSAVELETHTLLAREIGYLAPEASESLLDGCSHLLQRLNALLNYLGGQEKAVDHRP